MPTRRTANFDVNEWFPNGMANENGSLWTLLTDSQKHVELLWEETDANISPSLFNKFFERVTADTSIEQDSILLLLRFLEIASRISFTVMLMVLTFLC